MKIYVGNLAAATTDTELTAAFAAHGKVAGAQLATDKETGKPKGYGIVEMGNDTEAQAAITALHGSQLGGNELKVNESKQKGEAAPPRTAKA